MEEAANDRGQTSEEKGDQAKKGGNQGQDQANDQHRGPHGEAGKKAHNGNGQGDKRKEAQDHLANPLGQARHKGQKGQEYVNRQDQKLKGYKN